MISKVELGKCLVLVSAFLSPQVLAVEYFINGNFNAELSTSYTIQDCNGTIARGSNFGLNGNGVQFTRDGNVVVETCQWKNRVELYAKDLVDVPQGSSRWTAFSFKLVNTDAIGTKGAVIQQWYSKSGDRAKSLFYINKNGTDITISLQQNIRCNYPDSVAQSFVNVEGEYLCDPDKIRYVKDEDGNDTTVKETFRRIQFVPYPIVVGKWYHVRVGMYADAPEKYTDIDGNEIIDTVADGTLQADIRPEDGVWKAFSYNGPAGKQNYLKTFTHEVSEDMELVSKNQFKFGWYGDAAAATLGVIQFDEIYSNSYFSALPALYRN